MLPMDASTTLRRGDMTLHWNIDDLRREIRKLLPTASFEKDNYGQIVIYTGMVETTNGGLREITKEDRAL